LPLALLLDEHLSPALAQMLRNRGVDAVPLQHWREGTLLGQPDEQLLIEAAKESRILVSYDVATLGQAAQELTLSGQEHAGVLLISSKTVPPDAYSRLSDIMESFAGNYSSDYLRNVVLFAQTNGKEKQGRIRPNLTLDDIREAMPALRR